MIDYGFRVYPTIITSENALGVNLYNKARREWLQCMREAKSARENAERQREQQAQPKSPQQSESTDLKRMGYSMPCKNFVIVSGTKECI